MTRAAVNKRQANRAVPLAHPAVNTGLAKCYRVSTRLRGGGACFRGGVCFCGSYAISSPHGEVGLLAIR